MNSGMQQDLFDSNASSQILSACIPNKRPAYFKPERIVLAKGALASIERREFVERICSLFPEAECVNVPEMPHNRFDLEEPDMFQRHVKGKRTLLFGELKSAVRFSEEEGNTCPNYWHFSPYGFCPYGCQYCYLSGTQGVWHSPVVKVYVNLPEILETIDTIARRLAKPTAFYLGKLQDGLALDPLTAYSKKLIPFFSDHPFARQVILTKSNAVENLLNLEHKGRTILSWSLNPPEIAEGFEENVPSVGARIAAMRRCAEKGYPVRTVLMPIIPEPDWRDAYANFLTYLLSQVTLDRLTLGGICIYTHAKFLMERKIGRSNPISLAVEHVKSKDGRLRYDAEQRVQLYRHLLDVVRSIQPDLDVALCLEDPWVWKQVGLQENMGQCNCVL